VSYATRDAILQRLRLAERDVESVPLGGTLRLRELTRAQWRACALASSAGEGKVNLDLWHAHLFATGVIDATGAPLFTADEILALPQRDDLWEEIARIADLVMEVSEVGNNFRDSEDSEPAAE
jgi:hypothetical protein